MVAESFLVLYFLGQMPLKELQTSVFLYLLYSNIFNLLNIRERRNFWNSFPSKVMGLTIIADVVLSFIIASLGIPGLVPITPLVAGEILGFAALFNFILNNFVKLGAEKMLKVEW
jgi:H+-transporting ATPase